MKTCSYATIAVAIHVAAAAWAVSDFDWDSVTPATSLNFTSCYDVHRCAKLQVPLDWLAYDENDSDASQVVTLAVITRPAVVDITDPTFGGTIITNPGGPGGSGVHFLLAFGNQLQERADGDKKFGIMSFDPRGVGLTTPAADCHRDEFARSAWKLENRALGPVNAGYAVAAQKSARASAFGQLCNQTGGGGGIQGFASTSSVVRDMVRIIDELALLRRSTTLGASARIELRDESGPARLMYWGFSYGSALGQYFASMFPGRVGRMILDGIVDIHDYAETAWSLNLADTQDALAHLWETCFEARDRCALFQSSDKAAQDIEHRVRNKLFDQLEQAPDPFVTHRAVMSITKQDVLDVIFQALYDPLPQFGPLANVLAEAMKGNYTGLYSRMHMPGSQDSCQSGAPTSYTWMHDSQLAIMCGDGESRANMTVADILELTKKLEDDSPDFGGAWIRHVLECSGWKVRPKYRFTGPWTTPPAEPGLVEGRPAAPLFFTTSQADPVTPRGNAFVAAMQYPGSQVLVQKSVGHCAVSTPSRCTNNHIKRYLDTGKLPPKGTICEADCKPFEDCASLKSLSIVEPQHGVMRGPLELF